MATYAHIGLRETYFTPVTGDDGNTLTDFIFPASKQNEPLLEPLNFSSNFERASEVFANLHNVKLYMTGRPYQLTPTILAAVSAGLESFIVMHYDRDSETYVPIDMTPCLNSEKA